MISELFEHEILKVHRIHFKHFEMEWSEWFTQKNLNIKYMRIILNGSIYEVSKVRESDSICCVKKSGFSTENGPHTHTCAEYSPKRFHVFIPLILYGSLVHDLAATTAPAYEVVSNSIDPHLMVLGFNFTPTIRRYAEHSAFLFNQLIKRARGWKSKHFHIDIHFRLIFHAPNKTELCLLAA